MPGTNAGTGQPLTMRCGWCRKHTGTGEARRGYNVEVTGRVAPLITAQVGHGGSRVLQCRVEYRCCDCGRLGWSRHSAMRIKLRNAGFEMLPNIHRPQTLPRTGSDAP